METRLAISDDLGVVYDRWPACCTVAQFRSTPTGRLARCTDED
jgi:hypothetical protein